MGWPRWPGWVRQGSGGGKEVRRGTIMGIVARRERMQLERERERDRYGRWTDIERERK